MLTAVFLSLQFAALAPADGEAGAPIRTDSSQYRGDAGELLVRPPRVEAPEIRIDGILDEAEWSRAAVLAGFTQYQPIEGAPASERTEVRVFYAPDAIYFGVHAYDSRPDLVRATLTDRDGSRSDDWVRILLDTFDDRRKAYAFYVNPLGIQTDGLFIEGSRGVDTDADFIWDSFGRRTEDGWVAEIRIPYVSIRFPETPVQSWGINVMRQIRRSGYEQAWAPLRKGRPSTLGQSGRLIGLTGLRAKRLVELNPVLTASRLGTGGAAGDFRHASPTGDFGLNARYGITSNLMLDATYNPDFSQVEADADQITVNERFAIFYAEKRPFFLEGAEIFRTPQRLVHTRQIADPVGGAKLTGKVGGLGIGYLGALDASSRAATGEHAAFNLLRVRGDIGSGSTVGLLFTDRTLTGGEVSNRVLSGDARLLVAGHTITAQVARSWDVIAGGSSSAPLIAIELDRTARNYGYLLAVEDVAGEFRARTGFIRRPGEARVWGGARVTRIGEPGAFVETASLRAGGSAWYSHHALWRGGSPQEGGLNANLNVEFRGRHRLEVKLGRSFFVFDPGDFAHQEVPTAAGREPFRPAGRLDGLDGIGVEGRVRLSASAAASAEVGVVEVPIYTEAARARELSWRPQLEIATPSGLRLDASFRRSMLEREDGTRYSTASVSRVRGQVQLTRALMARGLAQYNLSDRDALRDPATGLPILIGGSPVQRRERGAFGTQLLAAYQPSPGTVVYAGYGRQLLAADDTYRLGRMHPTDDGLFLKVSYLFRL